MIRAIVHYFRRRRARKALDRLAADAARAARIRRAGLKAVEEALQ